MDVEAFIAEVAFTTLLPLVAGSSSYRRSLRRHGRCCYQGQGVCGVGLGLESVDVEGYGLQVRVSAGVEVVPRS